jgi:hypothetical protein
MSDNIPINQPDETIAAFLPEWTRHRLIINGAAMVRANASLFLPMVEGQSREDFAAYVRRVTFYPAAKRTHDGLVGLIFRKPATVKAPANAVDVMDTITESGLPVDGLARKVASELLTTNYCALVTDYPIAPSGITKAQAINLGIRPRVSFYPAGSILGVPKTAVINNHQRVVRVRLLDDVNTVRELRVDDGVYSVTIHRNNNGQWTADAPIIPMKNGKPLDEMPFTLISTNDDFHPGNAHLAPVCELNVDHYLASADYATTRFMASVRVFVVKGAEKDKKYPVYPGVTWTFDKTDVDVDILGASDSSINELKDAMLDIENKMALVGSRILENPKAAVEAAETIALRRAADNASTQSVARVINDGIKDALKWVAWWMDYAEGDFAYDANTDFNAIPLTPGERAQIIAEWQGGFISKQTALAQYVAHGNLPESFDPELDAELIAQEMADRPPNDAA